MTEESRIHLIYLNATGYVFNSNDYMKLRSEFRIVGKFIGTPKSRGLTSGMPVELTKFETQLLVDKGIAILLKKHTLEIAPIENRTQDFLDSFQKRVDEQEDLFINSKLAQSKLNMNKIIFGKKKKNEISAQTEKDVKFSEDEVLHDIRSEIKFNNNNALSDISCEHIYKHDAEVLTEYSSLGSSLKYCVFKDIWEKGHYITSGVAFGADFIAYPGDPLIYHAAYIIIVKNNDRMNIYDVIAKCRLAVTVNKILIYAYQNDAGNILYQTINWQGQHGT